MKPLTEKDARIKQLEEAAEKLCTRLINSRDSTTYVAKNRDLDEHVIRLYELINNGG